MKCTHLHHKLKDPQYLFHPILPKDVDVIIKRIAIQFFHISRGSLYEVESLLTVAMMVEIITENDFNLFVPKIDECIKIINGLISYYEKSNLK